MSERGKGQESRREKILRVATRIFSEKTYYGTTMKDIADAVGIRKGSLYYYITSKEMLLADIILGAIHNLYEGLLRVENADLTPVERMREIVMEHVKYNAKYKEAGTLFVSERSVISSLEMDKLVDTLERRDKLLVRTLSEGVEKGLFRPVDIRMTTVAIVGLCNSVLFWYRPSGRLSYEEIADIFFELVYHGLSTTS